MQRSAYNLIQPAIKKQKEIAKLLISHMLCSMVTTVKSILELVVFCYQLHITMIHTGESNKGKLSCKTLFCLQNWQKHFFFFFLHFHVLLLKV